MGITFSLPEGYEQVEWYGRGPHENYRDRNRGARVGKFTSTVTEMHTDYIFPQANGNRTDLRWLKLTNQDRVSLTISSDTTFEATVSHYSEADFCLLYTSPSPRDLSTPRMPSSA